MALWLSTSIVDESNWRSFTVEIHRVDTVKEKDAGPPSSSPSGSGIQGYTISLGVTPAGVGNARCEAARGSPMARAAACKGSARTRRRRPPARCRLRATTLATGVTAHANDVQRRCLCRAMAAQ
ncbi:hypothetical protein GW17_00024543 [Ensete ventricosum]|nr:hypothetical protein GW17_00024543 [Ensete ventricosum]